MRITQMETTAKTIPNVRNEAQQELAQAFAAETKIGLARVEALIDGVLATLPERKAGAGRKAHDDTVELREKLIAMKDVEFTSASAAEKFGVKAMKINNALTWCKNNGVNLVAVGTEEKVEGKRGKPATIWMIKS